MLGLVLSGLGAAAGLAGQYQQNQAINKMQGPDLDAIKSEMSPWQSKVSAFANQAGQLQQQGQRLSAEGYNLADQGQGLVTQGAGMMDPSGAYQTQQATLLGERLGDTSAEQAQRMSGEMAKRSMGGGGISSLMDQVMGNRAQESLRLGMSDIQQSGFQRGMGMQQMGFGVVGQGLGAAGQGASIYGQGASLYGQAAGMQGDISENMVRAQEASRQFENEQAQAQAQSGAGMWNTLGSGLMGFGSGLS